MDRVSLVRILKGIILFLAAIGAVFYAVIFPQLVWDFALAGEGEWAWMGAPAVAAVSVSAVPIVIALALFWRICTEIGRDNSFSSGNARRLTGIGICALVDSGYCAVGTVTVSAITGGHLGVTLLAAAVILGGLAIAAAALLLSHLVQKAAAMKDENDLTI